MNTPSTSFITYCLHGPSPEVPVSRQDQVDDMIVFVIHNGCPIAEMLAQEPSVIFFH